MDEDLQRVNVEQTSQQMQNHLVELTPEVGQNIFFSTHEPPPRYEDIDFYVTVSETPIYSPPSYDFATYHM